jgi:hypothetical protein
MYYEVAPTTMNGVFDFYTCQPIKGYWALYGFSDLCDLGTHIRTVSDDPDLYAVAAKDESGRSALLVTYYTHEENREEKTVTVTYCGADPCDTDIYTEDESYSYEKTATVPENATHTVTLSMKPNTFAVLKRGI